VGKDDNVAKGQERYAASQFSLPDRGGSNAGGNPCSTPADRGGVGISYDVKTTPQQAEQIDGNPCDLAAEVKTPSYRGKKTTDLKMSF
jgi:hypothetical protein